ncbi:MAG TPA: SRPBCC family protein [Pseudonocardiaceae bacterium]
MDVEHEISRVERTVGSRVLPAGDARVVTVSRTYRTPAEDVWDACTSAERIARWFMPVSGTLEVGGHYQLEGNAGGTISSCDPPRSFAATWEYGGDVSWIEVTLTPTDDGTRFTLDHISHVDDERWAEYGPGAVGVGWDLGLYGLTQHLADPSADVHAQGMEWAGTDEARRFMTLSSEAWYRAAVAGGDTPTIARAAADRTIAAYTGT